MSQKALMVLDLILFFIMKMIKEVLLNTHQKRKMLLVIEERQ